MGRIVTSDGVEIAYHTWGRRDRSPVLMIQGLGMDSRGWALQRGAFGRRHRCVAPDNRGTGLSDAPAGPYDLSRMAEDAVEVLDAEGIERAHVVGASMGGVIAQIIGVLHPERTLSLTLACTACRHHEWRRELLQEWADMVGRRGMRAMAEEDGMRWLVGPRLHRRFGVWINVLARVLMQTKPEPFVSQVQAILNATDELREELHTIRVPTLVITGSQDTLTPVGDAEELAEMIPTARLYVLSRAAHGLMAETPMAFNEAVLNFIDEVDAAGAVPAAPTADATQESA
ncbi:MAG: 3-oxoadipate enol-lactonase [Acidimicrobiia bacterium]|nr:MAG: 3-oxoadipate enol-lactonase [Acidimicrobiia bacterium]